jgi:hypothetical protein
VWGTSKGQGGGVIDIDVARYLHLDGILMSLGGSATGDNSGGGSGGSIHVVAVNFSGHGKATTEGGKGFNLGHGGGGGILFLLSLSMNNFTYPSL